jgi:SAM-dependent methyltransferase
MDIWEKWTKTSMKLQDNLFRRIDAEGNYFPHQPIYGFAPYRVLQYCEAYLLLSLLDEIHFDNFIDIGCAEGFYPRLVSARYGVDAYGVDLSAFGIHRMREYHKLNGVCADAHALPIKDCSFDVVLCNNTVEHVSDPKQVVSELMRIARKYVFIGVPQALTQKEIDTFQPDFNGQKDLHVHIFDQSALNRIMPANYAVTVHYASSLPVLALNAVYKRTIGRIANCLPLVKTFLYIDRLGCRLFPRRTIHILGKIDLTEAGAAQTQKRRSRRHGNIPDFILRKIHDLNRKELGSTVLKLGTDKSQKWKEFTVNLSEQNPSLEVSVSDEILAFLACPRCKGDIALYHDNTLVCQNCGASYAIEDGIPIMYDL